MANAGRKPGKAASPGPMAGAVAGLLVVTLAGAGAGGVGGLLLLERVERAARAGGEAAQPPQAQGKPAAMQSTSLRPLAPIVTNLAEPQRSWVRLEASVVFEGEPGADADLLAAKVSEDIVALLRTLPLAQIEGASGFQFLRDDLLHRVRTRSAGRIRDIVIHAFVIE